MTNQARHCVGVMLGLEKAKTQLTEAETVAIEELARSCETVVELGVFEGVTSARIASAMSRGRLFCVDPFFSGRLGIPYGLLITRHQLARAKKVGLRVEIVRKMSYDYVREAPDRIDLLFVDADHSYAAVKRDWDDWLPKVASNGYIALHDSRPIPGRCSETCGPVRLAREIRASRTDVALVREVDTLSVFQKLAES